MEDGLTSSADKSSKKHSFVLAAMSIVCALTHDNRHVARSAIARYRRDIRHDELEEDGEEDEDVRLCICLDEMLDNDVDIEDVEVVEVEGLEAELELDADEEAIMVKIVTILWSSV